MNATPEEKNKLVSIIIPSYNAAMYLPDSVGSVIAQTYPSWELIIVDDGSTDNTAQVLQPYLNDKRITYVKKENGGVSRARNYGAELAKGAYLCFLDADDFFHEDNLSEKVKALNADEATALVHADIRLIDAKGQATGGVDAGLSGKNLHLDLLLWQQCVVPAPSSIMVRKDAFDKVGQWDPAFSTAADQDFFIRIAKNYNIQRIPKALTSYRMLDASMSKNPTVFERDHLGVFRKAEKNYLFPTQAFKRKCFSNLHLIIAGTWWGQRKQGRALRHLLRALAYHPPAVFARIRKKALSS